MTATVLNLAIAIVEGRNRSVRNIARGMDLNDFKSVPDLQRRLVESVDRIANQRIAKALSELLGHTLRILPAENSTDIESTAFLDGVTSVEMTIERVMKTYHQAGELTNEHSDNPDA